MKQMPVEGRKFNKVNNEFIYGETHEMVELVNDN